MSALYEHVCKLGPKAGLIWAKEISTYFYIFPLNNTSLNCKKKNKLKHMKILKLINESQPLPSEY
jgi:hypothetical protein